MKVKRVFRGVPKGQFHPVKYNPGDTLPPELVAAAKAVGADQDYPEGGAPVPVAAQAVSQKGANGKSGRTVGVNPKPQSPPPPPPPPPPPNSDLLTGGEGGNVAPAPEGENQTDGGAGGKEGEGSDDTATEAVPGSGEPNLGGLS